MKSRAAHRFLARIRPALCLDSAASLEAGSRALAHGHSILDPFGARTPLLPRKQWPVNGCPQFVDGQEKMQTGVERICSRAKRLGNFSRDGRRTKSTEAPTSSSASPAISSRLAVETGTGSSSVTERSTSLQGPITPRPPSQKPHRGCRASGKTDDPLLQLISELCLSSSTHSRSIARADV